ncbi:MAG: LacI family transcriptional regulator [Deltaproteobacteria bacterium]|nr:LacI family transcriptional regulator [Deltaproteobacteria bacterium]
MYQHRLAAGIIVVANRTDDPRLQEAWKMKVPIVLIPGFPWKQQIPCVDGDSVNGVFKAVNYLVGLGHKRIAFLNGPSNSKYTLERLEAFRQALRRTHLPFDESILREYDFTQEMGYEKMKELLRGKEIPSAVLMINDYSAMGVFQAAKEMSLRIPFDISVVGFGDIPFAHMMDPPLTTVHLPFHEVGYKAAEMVIRLMQGKKLKQKHIIFPTELIIRKSTASVMN